MKDRRLPVLEYRRLWKDLFVGVAVTATLSWAGLLGLVLIGGGNGTFVVLTGLPLMSCCTGRCRGGSAAYGLGRRTR